MATLQLAPSHARCVPVDDQRIVVFLTAPNAYGGSARFNYQVVGPLYPWWERPFINQPIGFYYSAVTVFSLVVLCIVTGCCWGRVESS